jgi:hypothetical protein
MRAMARSDQRFATFVRRTFGLSGRDLASLMLVVCCRLAFSIPLIYYRHLTAINTSRLKYCLHCEACFTRGSRVCRRVIPIAQRSPASGIVCSRRSTTCTNPTSFSTSFPRVGSLKPPNNTREQPISTIILYKRLNHSFFYDDDDDDDKRVSCVEISCLTSAFSIATPSSTNTDGSNCSPCAVNA